jgi:hypothetical protein
MMLIELDLNNDINIAFQGPDEGRVVRDHIARMFFFIIFKCNKVHV